MIRLAQKARPLPVVSIVPLIDVLLILLVFFMVTSTYLDLDMVPLSAPGTTGTGPSTETTLFVRMRPDGSLQSAGHTIRPDDFEGFLSGHTQSRVLLLPSPQADVQALVTVLDTAERLGLASIDVVRFEGAN